MFFKRKRRNRRHSRGYVLDVKLSASQRRETRLRRLTLVLGSALVLFFTVFVIWRGGDMAIRHFIYENQAFAIRIVDVETDGVLSAEQIRSWAGVRMNDNLLALDLARVERDLKLVPAIESVVLERVLPSGLRIRVTEREPIAQVNLPAAGSTNLGSGAFFTLDLSGHFMFPVAATQRATPVVLTNEHLPMLTGIPARDVRPGRQTETPQVLAALALVREFGRSSMSGVVDLKEINVATPGALIVTTGQGNELTFGLTDFEAQLRRWRLVHEHANRAGKLIKTLDLSVANNSPMLWVDSSSAVPVPPPKPLKASPYRKKHV
jgi:cell division septal protein FtsQ